MKKSYKKLLGLILALVMLASTAMSCGNRPEDEAKPDNNVQSTGAGDKESTATAESETEDPDAYLYEALPKTDLSGRSFNVLIPTHLESEYIAELTGNVLEDSIYERNLTVEDALGVKLNFIPTAGLWDDRTNFMTAITSSVMAKDDAYQLVSGYAAYITSMASDGVLANWNDISDVDFTKPWWNSNIADEMNIAGKLYFVTGDLSLTSTEYLFCQFFNKGLAKNLGREDLYTIVKEGRWTLDALKQYTTDVAYDVDGNGKMDKDDRYGYISDDSNYISGFQAAFDADVTRKDENGIPQLAVTDESFINKFMSLYTFLRETPSSFLDYMSTSFAGENDTTAGMFKAGNALIMADMLGNASTLRDSDVDFGIVPYPKYDEAQQNYHTTAWDAYALFCIPITSDLKTTGVVAENLAAYSYKTVVPAFYDVALKTKYARDVESSDMIDIIREGATFNFGTVNSIHCANCGHIYRNLVQGSNPNIASYVASNTKIMKKSLERFVTESYLG